jgi:hypothetical protein
MSFLKRSPKRGFRLKTCPFCGGKAEIWRVPETDLYVVGCVDDHLCMGNINHITRVFVSAESAAKTWNKRAYA